MEKIFMATEEKDNSAMFGMVLFGALVIGALALVLKLVVGF
jgi:hypothetical protein